MAAFAFSLALGPAGLPAVDGGQLTPGVACYAIARGDTVIGATRQTVARATHEGVPTWDVIVHQRVGDGQFDVRDHFVLRQSDLSPILLESRRSGTERIRIDYLSDRLVIARPGARPQEIALNGRVWDGNLWGLTFAALPLSEGARFELPVYQYDRGFGHLTVQVAGSEMVGSEPAWVVLASADGQRQVRYFIGKTSRAELGYAGEGFAQRLGGDCSRIPQ